HKLEADKAVGVQPQLPATDVIKAWPQTGYNTEHKLPNAAVDLRPKKAWQADIGAGSNSDSKLLAQPVSDGHMVYTMDSEGQVKAFDLKSGDRKWAFDTTPKDRDG